MLICLPKQGHGKEIYTELTKNTTKSISTLLQDTEDRAKRIILDGDFNSNENWEKYGNKGGIKSVGQ